MGVLELVEGIKMVEAGGNSITIPKSHKMTPFGVKWPEASYRAPTREITRVCVQKRDSVRAEIAAGPAYPSQNSGSSCWWDLLTQTNSA